ncbi:MAG: SH3 domain-containing protein [Bacteroidetes bacterium]|nr:SH3 domain-containing protein [Bacteroidota bacterium]
MKNLYLPILIISLIFFVACGSDDTESSASTSKNTEANTAEEETEPIEEENQIAICLWGQAGLRSAPGRGSDAKWVSGISFGEIVLLTGNTKEIQEQDRARNYLEMELSDGKSGWSYDYLFAVNAERGVAKQDIDIYKRPELTTFDGDKFERGEVLAYIKGDKEGWYEAFGKEKKKSGWVRSVDAISTDEVDVTVSILVDKANEETNPAKKQELLENISNNNTFKQSVLIDMVDSQLTKVAEKMNISENQLYVTTDNLNVRSAPDTEADNVVFQLKDGSICDILEVGPMKEIRDMQDYWYKISFEGKEGWIYGAFTSKKQEN